MISIRLLLCCFILTLSCSFYFPDHPQINQGNDQIINALKEALKISADSSVKKAHKINGFFGNPLIKIPFPPEAKKVETAIRSAGFGTLIDNFILKLNRAAEDASGKSLDIFINAIKSMTIKDGLSILNGKNDAATQFLRLKTYNNLKLVYKPVIRTSLQNAGAAQVWTQISSKYNSMPFVKKVNTDLPEYATQKALDGMFVLIAQQELKIRKDPKAQVTDLLKKVFGKYVH